ncbi:MAG: anthranilate phosphoribosyltransferase [Bacteroidetes bacterium]|nr:MAG: anthranilate phosphoribosyltransferase [Bacteroidota bacterium]RLD93991.1 MAG: anthranilate phosphoribosyltransferase [Bacteroidota bacterium]
MKETLQYLFDHKTLGKEDAKVILRNMAAGKYNEAEMAAFISVYLMRSITVEELAGFRDALMELCTPVDLSDFNTIDVCGTGGDEKNTFNISTLTSFVVAGAGEKVAKHGNYSVSSACGSSNVLEYFGYTFSSDPDRLRREIDQFNICFLHAPLFNPAMKNVAPVRRSLRIKTFFNMLGPMVNPSNPGNQLVGVFSLDVARLYHYLYQESDKQFCIIHSLDGFDEISLTGSFRALTRTTERTFVPGDLGLDTVSLSDIYGGSTVEEAAGVFLRILEGKGSRAQNDVVVANAALALYCMDESSGMERCLERARQSLESGKAYTAFKQLVNHG